MRSESGCGAAVRSSAAAASRLQQPPGCSSLRAALQCGVHSEVYGEVAGEVVVWRVFDEVVKRWGGMLSFRICICQQSVGCVDLDYYRCLWVFGVYGLVEFAMQLGEV